MLTINELEIRNGITIIYNNDGSQTIFNDETGIVTEKNIYNQIVHQTSCAIYVKIVKTMIRLVTTADYFVKAPNMKLWVNKYTADIELQQLNTIVR